MDATATIRMEDYEKKALTEFAEFQGKSFSEWARQTLCEAYEDYMDYQIAADALKEFRVNPATYTAAEVEAMMEADGVDA